MLLGARKLEKHFCVSAFERLRRYFESDGVVALSAERFYGEFRAVKLERAFRDSAEEVELLPRVCDVRFRRRRAVPPRQRKPDSSEVERRRILRKPLCPPLLRIGELEVGEVAPPLGIF